MERAMLGFSATCSFQEEKEPRPAGEKKGIVGDMYRAPMSFGFMRTVREITRFEAHHEDPGRTSHGDLYLGLLRETLAAAEQKCAPVS